MANLENLKRKSNKNPNYGGARPGAGRKKGGHDQHTVAARKATEMYVARVAQNAGKLFNAQLDKALGEKFLMREHKNGNGKLIVDIVTSPKIIQQYLDGTLETGNDDYYYITTRPAHNGAITDLLNRGLGKPTENIEADITSDGERIAGISDAQFTQLIRARSNRGNL